MQHLLDPTSPSHRRTQKRCRALLAAFESHTAPIDRTSQTLAATLATIFAPSTTQTYLHTIVKMVPKYRDEFLPAVTTALAQEVARSRKTRQLPPMKNVVRRLHATPSPIWETILLQFVSASRHADLPHGRLTNVWPMNDAWSAVAFAMPIWKSDRKGTKFARKTILWPNAWAHKFSNAWKTKVPYAPVYRALKGCSVHDLRRLAIQAVAERLSETAALTLTGHAAATTATAAVRRYAPPTLNAKEAQLQIEASKALWTIARERVVPKLD